MNFKMRMRFDTRISIYSHIH